MASARDWILAELDRQDGAEPPPPAGTITLYEQQAKNTYSNFNWNSSPDAYAWQWTPTASGTPTQIILPCHSVVGTATGDISIRSDRTSTSTSFGSATAITFVAGDNVIDLSGAAPVAAGSTYWVYFKRTSASSS